MIQLQLNVMNSPFNQEQTENLNRLLPTLSKEQRIWLSGFLAAQTNVGVATSGQPSVDTQQEFQAISEQQTREVTVLFGSETGNGQMLAEELVEKLTEQKFKTTSAALDDFKPKNLKKVEDLLIITATHGEGDPPDNAISFYEFLHSRKAPKLNNVRFSVLALGDQSYEFYCQTGKDFDKRLGELGGERLTERVDCDLDFDEPAAEWMNAVLAKLNETRDRDQAKLAQVSQEVNGDLSADQPAYSRTNPFMAEVLENLNLSGKGSEKETRHLELSLEGSNLAFEPGDSIGIFSKNDLQLVDQLIEQMQWNPEETVTVNKQGDIRSLREALVSNFEITLLTKPLIQKAADLFDNDQLKQLVEQEEKLKDYLDGRDVLDLVKDFPPAANITAEQFIQILRKMPARLYSVASSYKANPDEVHLTVGTVRYHSHGRERVGVCSGQIAERVKPGEALPIYVHRNPNFRFPTSADTPVIMIGPGTGVAPFRSFLEEREEAEVSGKTWLFFGDQHFLSDFLYQVDWQRWIESGVLNKMDVAFSRDTDQKIYVQHRMLEKSQELYTWLLDGAHVYVCGDEKHMAKDVHDTLRAILIKEGSMNEEQADQYLTDMRKERRYQRDVY